ncbi:hypothetical protein SAMN05216251_11830 [Actinacidiphila alni]|uniref:Uncharacterized protein n=1 Tax=Actinacidiphila alni TaxID=380248 RepID=A0A1I2JJ08_9ACTN|nr:hypothetical protein [Actinacidiphila alni]SFF54068.1 hypothetical protein SAMN05216251_11830 [Actinacidiphila alni]
MGDRQTELARLARDLDALTGAGMLLEVASHDAQFTPVMLRLIVRHGEFAAQRARRLLATEYRLAGDRGSTDEGGS